MTIAKTEILFGHFEKGFNGPSLGIITDQLFSGELRIRGDESCPGSVFKLCNDDFHRYSNGLNLSMIATVLNRFPVEWSTSIHLCRGDKRVNVHFLVVDSEDKIAFQLTHKR